jgi:hypothetical protein
MTVHTVIAGMYVAGNVYSTQWKHRLVVHAFLETQRPQKQGSDVGDQLGH